MIESKNGNDSKATLSHMQTKHYYLQQSRLPENFSMEKLDQILNMLYPELEEVENVSEYTRLLESIGVLLYKDDSSTLLFLRPIDSLVKQYIKNCLAENNINADETIINEIVNDDSTYNSNIINLRALKNG